MLEDLKGNLKSPEDIANDIKLFNQSFDYHVCTTSPLVATSKAKHPSYEDFHRVITSYNDSSHNISNACFLSNDVVFLKINLNKTILSYESTHKCLKTSHLTTEMSNNNKPVPLTLNIGSHPKNQSEWSRAVVSFHDEALQWDSQEQQSREWRTEKHHQNLYSKIMNETFHKSTNIINQGTESKDDDLIVNFQEIMDYSQDQRHLRLLTFYKDGDNDPYQFKKLKLSYSKNQPQIDDGFMALYGSVYGIVLRKWGISLMLSSLKVHPGSSGSLMISGNETIGYEIMAALYSKDGQEYSTAHGPIDKADFIGRMTPRTDTTQPSDDDNDEKRAYSGTSTSKTTPRDSSTQQSTAVGDTKKREPQSNRSGDLNPNPQPVDRPDVGKEDEGEVAENEQPTNNQPQQQEEKGDDDKNRENFYNIRDTGEDDVRARDFGCN
ncbi:MAG: hypothetical protein OXC44_00575, partial [Proteobacteria bacterium]|nr:hypothetical protein [Pseudomonadota bacterium]